MPPSLPHSTALAFLFCGAGNGDGDAAVAAAGTPVARRVDAWEGPGEVAAATGIEPTPLPCMLASTLRLPPLEPVGAAAMLLPAAVAAHSGPSPLGVVLGCAPVVPPFSFPEVSPNTWLVNRRALAFHRGCVFAVYAQGALAIFKFVHGDLVGGTYDALQALMGGYATQPDGIGLLPTWIMVSGFNGVFGIFQVFQAFQGVPLHFLPMLACGPPVLSLCAAYFGWQFFREVRALAGGLPGDGPQDTCFVRVMGADCWPLASLSPPSSRGQPAAAAGGLGSTDRRFPAFEGQGHRLGES